MTPPEPPTSPVQTATSHPRPLDGPDRLRAACASLGWTARALAMHCRVSSDTGWDWMHGRVLPPERVVVWAEGVARFLEENPAPGKNSG